MFFYSPVIFFRFYNKLTFTLFNLQKQYLDKFLTNTTFLNKYLYLNDVLWQEGFLIDFVQKKTTDKFIRKFLIHSMYLFNERLLFDKIIRVFSVTIQDVTVHVTQFDTNSVANVLFILLMLIAGLISLGGGLIILSSVWTTC
jgi:hypothetical protein